MADARNEFAAPADEDGLIAWLDKKRESAKGRVPDSQLRMNLAFLLGQQWIVWDGGNGRFKRPPAHRGDPNAPVRITANKIAGLVERAIAKLTRSAPLPEARPVSDSEEDVDAAKVGTRILDHEMYRLDWDALLTSFYFWPAALGWSYMHVYWDPDQGAAAGEMDGESFKQGEICVEEVPAFELVVDPNALKMDQARWAVRTTTMSREAVWEKWGKVPDGADSGRSLADDVYSLVDDSIAKRKDSANGDFVKVHQFWLRPGSRSKPEGMVVTWSGKTILENKPFPYDHGELPFVPFCLLPGVGTLEGRTWVTDLIPLQVDYNDARSREATIRRTLTPKVLAPTGSIDSRRVTSRVEVIDYVPTGEKPSLMIPDSGWLAQYETGMERADMEMGDRAGQQDVSAGKTPSASMPAAAIIALQEADDTRLAISAKELAKGIRKTGWFILQYVRQFWTEERTIRTWSADGDIEVQRFSGADITQHLDIHVSAESAMPKSKAARAQLATELKMQGVITDPRMYVRLLDIPGTDFIIESLSRDARKAHRENGMMMRGETPQVAPFDNHPVHMEEHSNEMKEAWYDEAEPTDPRRVAFDAHYAMHLGLNQSLLMAAAGGPMPLPSGGEDPTGDYLDPMTGKPSDPTRVAAGQEPSSLERGPKNIRERAQIGGPGNPGQVPGVDPDTQAAQMGR
jgi:hypothetical protein